MKFGSLFAGIGGLGLGLERAGMKCVWQVEIDDFCTKVLTKHWPSVPKFGDIRNVGKQNLETVDLIAGGFPCQPFSVAGKRRGTEDDRHLWPEMLRVISELRPTWVVAENVPGIIPIFLYQAIFDLAREGYKTLPIVLPACGFDAPHLRYRLFIVGHTKYNGFTSTKIPRGIIQRSNGSKTRESSTSEPKGSDIKRSSMANDAGATNEGIYPGGGGEVRMGVERNALHTPRREQGSNRLGCNGSENAPDSNKKRPQKREGQNTKRERGKPGSKFDRITRWFPEPGVGRVADGVPDRVDRLKSLGNAVVPQVAEHIGRMIMEANQ